MNGIVYDDTLQLDKDYWNIGKVYTINQEQAEVTLSFIDNYDEENQHNILDNNCTTFGVKVLEIIGIESPVESHNWVFPYIIRSEKIEWMDCRLCK